MVFLFDGEAHEGIDYSSVGGSSAPAKLTVTFKQIETKSLAAQTVVWNKSEKIRHCCVSS